MTLKHSIKLVVPKFKWIREKIAEIVRQWKLFKNLLRVRKKRTELIDLFIVLERKNTDESIEEAVKIKAQIEIINWILNDGI